MGERRKYGRKEPHFRVVCWTSDVPMRRIEAESVDVSFGGICLKLKEALKANEIVRLRIQKGLWQKPIEVLGRTAWQYDTGVSGKTRVGIKFVSAPWTRIEELLYS